MYLRDFIACSLLLLPAWASATAQPVRLDRQAVMQLLIDCTEDQSAVLSGQNAGHASDRPRVGYQRFIAALSDATGDVPAVASMDYGYGEIPTFLSVANEPLIEHWRGGGLVMVSLHPANPWTAGSVNDLGHGNFEDLFRQGTAVHTVWNSELERVARGLQELKEAGVVVMFRPFHEMNGGWFWWAASTRGQWLPRIQFERLWRETHAVLTEEKGLDNLLWVYSPAVQYGKAVKPTMHYYPGDDVVDLVALDWYTDYPRWADVKESYEPLALTGKPIGLAEFGPSHAGRHEFDNGVALKFFQESPRSWAFFSFWHSWDSSRMAIVDLPHASALMRSDHVINRNEIAERYNELRARPQSSP